MLPRFGRDSIQYRVGKTHCQGRQDPSKSVSIFLRETEANSKMVFIYAVFISRSRTVQDTTKCVRAITEHTLIICSLYLSFQSKICSVLLRFRCIRACLLHFHLVLKMNKNLNVKKSDRHAAHATGACAQWMNEKSDRFAPMGTRLALLYSIPTF